MSTTTQIRRVSYSEILAAPNATRLIDEYAAECSSPDHDPQVHMYAALEAVGALQCFGAYAAEDELLVGFASVLIAISPHNGKRIASVESIFVPTRHRNTGAGNLLLTAVEDYAAAAECISLIYAARVGSRLHKVLLLRTECEPSHALFTRWLA